MGLMDYYRNIFSRDPQAEDIDMQRLAAREELMREQEKRLGRTLTLGERAHISRLSNDFTPSQQAVESTIRDTREGLQTMQRLPNTAAAGAARLVTALPELGDLAVQGGQALADRSGKPFLQRFQEARHGEEGLQRMQTARTENMRRYREANPNATPEQIRRADDDYVKTEEYGAVERSTLGPVRGFIQDAGETIDRAFGAPVDREKNTADRVIGGVASAVVPTGAIARGLNLGARSDLAFNVIVPGARGGSALNYAGNAAAGAAVPLGIAALTQENVGREEQREQEERGRAAATAAMAAAPVEPKPDNSDLAWMSGAVGAGILAAIGLKRTQAVNQVARGAANTPPVPPGGNAAASVPPVPGRNVLQRTEDTIGAKFDDAARIQAALKTGGATRQEAREVVEQARTRFNPSDEASNFMLTGQSPYLTTPLRENFTIINQLQNALKHRGDWADVEMAITARSALDSRAHQLAQTNTDIARIQGELATASTELQKIQVANQSIVANQRANTQPLATQVSRLSRELTEANDRLAKIKADAPELRMQFPDLSTADLQARTARLLTDPMAKQYDDAVRAAFRADLDMRVNAGLISADRASQMRNANPNYVPIKHDSLGGLTGIAREAAKLTQRYGEGGDLAETAGTQLGGRVARRNLDDIPIEDRVKSNMPLVDQLNTRIRQTHFEIAQNDLRRNYITALEGRGQAIPAPVGPGKSNIVSPNSPVADGVLKNPKHVAYMRDGNIHVYRVDTPEIATAVKHMTDTWETWTRVSHELSGIQRKGLTGELNPIFATANYWYDFGATGFRGADKTFGTGNFVERYVHGQTGRVVDKVLRSTGVGLVDPGVHLPAAINGIRLFFHANGQRIASKIETDLAANFGIVNSLAGSNPRVRAMLHNMAQGLNNVLENSLVAKYIQDVGQQTPVIGAMTRYRREVESVFLNARSLPGVKESLPMQMLNGFAGMYRDMLYGAHNTMRYTYYSQRVAAETAKRGRQLIDKEMLEIASDARTITGDLRARSESKALRLINQNTLYFNVAMQAQRTMYQRLTEDPKVAAMMLSGVALPTIYGTAMVTSNPELSRWWFNEVPDWQKDSFFFLPNAQGLTKIARSMTGGQGFPRDLTREDFHQLLVPPDFRFIKGATRVVLEYTNAIQRPDTVPPATEPWDIRKGPIGQFLQNYVPGIPAPFDLALRSQGIRMQSQRAIEGNAIQTFNTNERMNINSSYSKGFEETLSVVLGTFGRHVADAFDTADQMKRAGNDTVSSWFAAGQDLAARASVPRSDLPLVNAMQERTYARNPTRDMNSTLRDPLELSTARRPPGSTKNRSAGSPLNDPILEGARQAMEQFYNRDPTMKALNEERTGLRRQRELMYGNKNITVNERNNAINDLNKRIINVEERQNQAINDFQRTIAEGQIGQQYQQMFQQPFTLKDWGVRAEAAYNNQQFTRREPRQRGQRRY